MSGNLMINTHQQDSANCSESENGGMAHHIAKLRYPHQQFTRTAIYSDGLWRMNMESAGFSHQSTVSSY
jgi:hypothetical protein